MDRVQRHAEICKELNDVYTKKNHDYGNSFGDTFDRLGIISAVTRISDKYNRLVSLCTKPEKERKVKDESITDTLLDMANYCIMTVIEMHKDKIEDCCDINDMDVAKPNKECEHDWVLKDTYTINDYIDKTHYFASYVCCKCGDAKSEELKEMFNIETNEVEVLK